jgi:hypothetical protein
MSSLCAGDSAGFKSYLTDESALLYDGLRSFDGQPFQCTSTGFAVGEGKTRHEGFSVVQLTAGTTQQDVVLVHRQGQWLIHLFFTEESAYFGEEMGQP